MCKFECLIGSGEGAPEATAAAYLLQIFPKVWFVDCTTSWYLDSNLTSNKRLQADHENNAPSFGVPALIPLAPPSMGLNVHLLRYDAPLPLGHC